MIEGKHPFDLIQRKHDIIKEKEKMEKELVEIETELKLKDCMSKGDIIAGVNCGCNLYVKIKGDFENKPWIRYSKIGNDMSLLEIEEDDLSCVGNIYADIQNDRKVYFSSIFKKHNSGIFEINISNEDAFKEIFGFVDILIDGNVQRILSEDFIEYIRKIVKEDENKEIKAFDPYPDSVYSTRRYPYIPVHKLAE